MNKVYSAVRPPVEGKSYAENICKINQFSSISCRGIIAFTSSFCLNQSKPTSSSYHLYVADINTPNRPFLVSESEHEFTIIEWDHFGSKLLSCDVRGHVTIYVAPDHLISDWQPVFKYIYPAEQFITAAWYHPGIVSTINLKSSSNHIGYNEKIQKSQFGASLKLFGGKAAEGCIIISSTGLVCCLTKFGDSYEVNTQSLGPLRGKVAVADISYHKDGYFILGTSAGPINSTILFYKIVLNAKNMTLDDMDIIASTENRVNILIEAHDSFHLNVLSQILGERGNNSSPAFEQVAHLKFVTKSSPDDVLVEVMGTNLSLIESWDLEACKPQPVHPIISSIFKKQSQNNDSNGKQQMEWSFKGNYIMEKRLVAMQTPRSKLFNSSRQMNIILLAYEDNSICCMRRDDLSPVCQFYDADMNVSNKAHQFVRTYLGTNNINNNNNNNRKTPKTHITDIQFSPNQCVFFTLDDMSQIQAIKLPHLVESHDDQDNYLQYLLEYSLLTGNDYWDVIVCAKNIENLCDRLDDAFQRQPKPTQNSYLNRHLTIRGSLYRCLNNEANLIKAADCHTMIMLNYISSTIKSNVRSHSQDLSSFLKQNANQASHFECNNVVEKLNLKEFSVEINLVQSLQPLIQWVTELAISWVVAKSRPNKQTCSSLANNREAIETVRELLIIIKIWGQQNEYCLPNIFKLDEKMDLIGTLFKLISMLNNSIGIDLDENSLEEFVRFSNSISIPQFSFMLNAIGVASPVLLGASKKNTVPMDSANNVTSNITLEYFQEPTMSDLVNLPKIEGAINVAGDRLIDVVRNISLGAHPVSNLRSCTRCQSVSLTKPNYNSARTWEQRWIKQCVCGGSWAQWSGDSKLEFAHYLANGSIANRSNYKILFHNQNMTHVPAI